MKLIEITILSFFCLALTQCSTANKAQKNAQMKFETQSDITFDQAYYQSWVAGVEGGGSGVNVFIPVTSQLSGLKPDSLYFRGNKVVLEFKPNNPNLYIGRILTQGNQKEDYKPAAAIKMPFELKDNEAVMSYMDKGDTKYIQIKDIVEKEAQHFPSAPPKEN